MASTNRCPMPPPNQSSVLTTTSPGNYYGRLSRVAREHDARRQRMAREARFLESCQQPSAPAWRAGEKSMNPCQKFNREQCVGISAGNASRRGWGKERLFPLTGFGTPE
eukprot:1647564-Pyramimonas_sp.AAC.1